jgi:hypothetical protein
MTDSAPFKLFTHASHCSSGQALNLSSFVFPHVGSGMITERFSPQTLARGQEMLEAKLGVAGVVGAEEAGEGAVEEVEEGAGEEEE